MVTHTACEWFVYGLNLVGVGFRNEVEFGATVWIRLFYVRDVSIKLVLSIKHTFIILLLMYYSGDMFRLSI